MILRYFAWINIESKTLAAASPEALRVLLPAILAGRLVALIYGVILLRRALADTASGALQPGRAFDPKSILGFTAGLAAIIPAAGVLPGLMLIAIAAWDATFWRAAGS